MRDLIRQEQFELEVLDRLKSGKLLNNLIFCGGTMLRLCFGLNRFSVDLDFWIIKDIDRERLFKDIKEYLSRFYTLKDAANKFNTILFELSSRDFPLKLKIEIRKETKKIRTEPAIAYSPSSNIQVYVKAVSLTDMMRSKIEAFLNRKEIRDAFDMEFLVKKGIKLEAKRKVLEKLLKELDGLTRQDYTVKLGSLLEEKDRKYYTTENFKILRMAINNQL